MSTSPISRSLVLALAVASALALRPASGLAQSAGALDADDVVELLRLSASAEARADMIRRSCVTFPLDAAATTRLRAAGADDALLEVVRTACFRGAELVVESRPAGAEVLVDDQRVGNAPWAGRYAAARPVRVTARAHGKVQTATGALEPGRRLRVAFGFREDTVPVPGVRATEAVVRDLGLERGWRTPEPEPRAPRAYRDFSSLPLRLLVVGGAMAAGVNYCGKAEHMCGLKPTTPGESVEDYQLGAKAIGALGGMVGGAILNGMIGSTINHFRRSGHERSVEAYRISHADWTRRMAAAKETWLREHPDVRRAVADDVARRDAALRRNAEIATRNRDVAPAPVVTVEPVGTP